MSVSLIPSFPAVAVPAGTAVDASMCALLGDDFAELPGAGGVVGSDPTAVDDDDDDSSDDDDGDEEDEFGDGDDIGFDDDGLAPAELEDFNEEDFDDDFDDDFAEEVEEELDDDGLAAEHMGNSDTSDDDDFDAPPPPPKRGPAPKPKPITGRDLDGPAGDEEGGDDELPDFEDE